MARIKFVVEINLESTIPGRMYSRESARKTLQKILDSQLGHYDPEVQRDPDFDPTKIEETHEELWTEHQ